MCAYNASLAGSVRSGRTFARFQFKKQDVESLTRDLNFATAPAVIQSAARIREYGRKVRDYLKANFPDHKTGNHRGSSKIREGWQVSFYSAATNYGGTASGGASLWGFYLSHKAEQNERVRTILRSIESGSREYFIQPGAITGQSEKQALSWYEGTVRSASKGHWIPARRGYGYIAKTEKYAESLLATHGGYLEQALGDIIQKGSRLKEMALGASTGSGTAIEDAVSAESIVNLIANQKTPLGAVRAIKKRLKAPKV